MTEDALLRKEQISSYFERIQAKKDGDEMPKSGFSVGSSTTTTTDVKTSHGPASTTAAAATTTTGKISLFSSQIKFPSDDTPPPPRTVELEKASTAAKCLAILAGVTSSAAPALPTPEEITASRRLREQEIMKQYEDIKRVEEENRNRRPLVWDKPTFCPFGGETKSDDEASASEEEESEEDKSSESNKNNKKRKEPSSSSSRVAEKCSNLLRKSSSGSIDPCSNLLRKTSSNPNRHNNLFPNFNMYGGMLSSASSVTVRTEWSKEEVDSFVEFTDKWILPGPKKKIKLDHTTTAEGSSSSTTSSSSNTTEGGGGEGQIPRRSSIGRPFLPQKVLPSDQA